MQLKRGRRSGSLLVMHTGTFPFLKLHRILPQTAHFAASSFLLCALLASSCLPVPFRSLFRCVRLRDGTERAAPGLSCGLSLACHAGPA